MVAKIQRVPQAQAGTNMSLEGYFLEAFSPQTADHCARSQIAFERQFDMMHGREGAVL